MLVDEVDDRLRVFQAVRVVADATFTNTLPDSQSGGTLPSSTPIPVPYRAGRLRMASVSSTEAMDRSIARARSAVRLTSGVLPRDSSPLRR